MRDQFVGDIGDFGKYGMLRYLCGVTGPKMDNPMNLGVVWHRNESGSVDGNKIGYLNVSDSNDSLYRECDKILYDTLQRLVGESLISRTKRNIDQIEQSICLSYDTKFYDVPELINDHSDWRMDTIFFDPDNGIALRIKSNKEIELQFDTNSREHVSLRELQRFAKQGCSLIIYQHSIRTSDWIKKIAEELEKISTTNHPLRVWALRWHREQSRVYFIVTNPNNILENRIKTFVENPSPWGTKKPSKNAKSHFTLAYPPKEI